MHKIVQNHFFVYLTICMIQKLGCMIYCVSHSFWNLSYPKHNFHFSVLFDINFFNQPYHPIRRWKKRHFFYAFTFFNHSSHLIPPNPTFEIIWQFCLTFTFSVIHPTQSHFWKCFVFFNNFPFFQYFIPPKSHSQTWNLVFGTEELICQKNLRVVGRGLGWQTVGLIPPMFISWMTIPPRSHQVKY